MRFLILHTSADPLATTVAHHLNVRHPGQVAAVTLWDLQNARRWSHAQFNGQTRNELVLANGIALDLDETIVFNRLTGITVPHYANASSEDRGYATEETHALALSWMKALPGPVINPATHAGLAGPYYDQLTWFMLAHRAGLPTPLVSFTSSLRRFPRPNLVPVSEYQLGQQEATLGEPPTGEGLTVAVVGDQVVGTHPITIREPLKALARLARVEFLEVYLNRVQGAQPRWVFNGANPVPFSVSDDALAALLYLIESKVDSGVQR